MKGFFAALLLLCLAAPVLAEEAPMFSLNRVHIACRAEYVAWAGEQRIVDSVPANKEWAVGIPVSYNFPGDRWDLTARVMYHVDSKVTHFAVGANYELPIWGGK